MAEEKNVASAAKPEQVDCLELVKKLADSYRCLIRRRELLRQQYEESKSWFYTKEDGLLHQQPQQGSGSVYARCDEPLRHRNGRCLPHR